MTPERFARVKELFALVLPLADDERAKTLARECVDDPALAAAPVPNQPGLFFHAMNQIQLPFGNGFLCASGGTVRGEVLNASGNVATYTYDNSDAKHRLGAYIGSTRHFQYWFRDSMGGGALFNTSNAISITVFP